MREYFCAYHDMLGAMRKLSDTECGRLFRALLMYSCGEQPDNLQGREELLFDVFSQQIDRDAKRYEDKCAKNKTNVSKRKRSITIDNDRTESLTDVNDGYQDKEKDKDKEEVVVPPYPPQGETAGTAAYVADNLRGMTGGNWEELRSYMDDGITWELVNFAVDEAAANGKRNWSYVRRILNRFLSEGITSVEQAKNNAHKQQPYTPDIGYKPKWVGDDD